MLIELIHSYDDHYQATCLRTAVTMAPYGPRRTVPLDILLGEKVLAFEVGQQEGGQSISLRIYAASGHRNVTQ